MQFKHPEYLYALFALIIPILVHLFQLRRFRKVAFTNVQFLQQVKLQTRKSSMIKKWLTLLARLLALAALVIAFAQPYFSNTQTIGKPQATAIYLDNSFSMQARGAKGPLLQRAVQELLHALPDDEVVSIFTNTETFKDITKKDIQNDLLQLSYTSAQLPYAAAYLKAKQLVGNQPDAIKRVIMVSDFQQKDNAFDIATDPQTHTHLVQLAPVNRANIAIDSIFLARNTTDDLVLSVQLSSTAQAANNVPVALYNEQQLMAKTTVSIPKNGTTLTQFSMGEAQTIKGRVLIEDPSVTFDNTRYFTINASQKIKVVTINGTDDQYLRNIYTPDEFELISSTLETLNYNDLSTAHLVVINEIEQLPISLNNALNAFATQGGSICLIPSSTGTIASYQQLISMSTTDGLLSKQEREKKITTIHFSHPLYKGVFDKEITNFQYPSVSTYYTSTASNPILSYEDNTPFLFAANSLYVFTAPINTGNSNFQKSPLIVPTLYNIGKQSLQVSDISYTIGMTNTYDIAITLGQDRILSLVSEEERVIPLQQNFANKVQVTTDDVPTKAGIYTLMDTEKTIQHVSYNYDQQESNLLYYNLSNTDQYQVSEAVETLFDQLKEENSIQEFWKWFVIFALLFLCIEMLLLKFLK